MLGELDQDMPAILKRDKNNIAPYMTGHADYAPVTVRASTSPASNLPAPCHPQWVPPWESKS